MVQAGSMGVPYVPVRGFSGSDVVERRPDTFKVAASPFEPGESFVVAKAITPDVAIFHGLKADQFGNVIVRKGGDELMLAQSARKVIVTVEEIVDAIDPDDTDAEAYNNRGSIKGNLEESETLEIVNLPPRRFPILSRKLNKLHFCNSNQKSFKLKTASQYDGFKINKINATARRGEYYNRLLLESPDVFSENRIA